jgi:hypothetical protein
VPILIVPHSAIGIAIGIAQSKALRRENAELCSAQSKIGNPVVVDDVEKTEN